MSSETSDSVEYVKALADFVAAGNLCDMVTDRTSDEALRSIIANFTLCKERMGGFTERDTQCSETELGTVRIVALRRTLEFLDTVDLATANLNNELIYETKLELSNIG